MTEPADAAGGPDPAADRGAEPLETDEPGSTAGRADLETDAERAPRPAPPPARVRVTAPRTGSTAASARPLPVRDGSSSEPASVYVRSLIRSQLRLGVTYALGFAGATAVFVLAVAMTPVLDETFVWGVPLSWLLLAVGVYPLAITVAVLYARAAARNEARYRALTEVE
ncbi:heavy metal transporter [Agromyces sp. Marseille-Q5079]|uniref:heavy metal transporter n=1 Tax=Agromyces sp. Marseille-Q5079 TaxID=3439059 RepID=UPI003D9CB5BA